MKEVDKKMVYLLIWVDDIIIAACGNKIMKETKWMLQEKFRMKDLGKPSYFWV